MNHEKLAKEIEFIERNRSRHNQLRWWTYDVWRPTAQEIERLHQEMMSRGNWDPNDLSAQPDHGEHLIPEWRCRTTACLAGWTAIHAGWRPLNPWNESMIYDPTDEFSEDDATITPGMVSWVKVIARRILDLTHAQGEALFIRAQTLNDIKEMTSRFATEERNTL